MQSKRELSPKRNLLIAGLACVGCAVLAVLSVIALRVVISESLAAPGIDQNLDRVASSSVWALVLSGLSALLGVLGCILVVFGLLQLRRSNASVRRPLVVVSVIALVAGLCASLFAVSLSFVPAEDEQRIAVHGQNGAREALFFTQNLPKGTVLRDEYMEALLVPSSQLPETYVAASNRVEGRVLRFDVRAHAPLMWTDMQSSSSSSGYRGDADLPIDHDPVSR